MPRQDQPPEPTNVNFRSVIDWYLRHCDETWEHQYGLRLETLDNAGWQLTVDLIGTSLEGLTMPEHRDGLSPQDHPVSPHWVHCSVRDNQFRGACDPTQVARLFEIFDHFMGHPDAT